MKEQTLFCWVHLSDIHVGHGDPTHRWDQRTVLTEIAEDVVAARQERPEIPPPDAILVTGDVAFSGNGVVRAPDTESREYARAEEWLLRVAGKLGLSAKDVFVVPGNHDVDRGKDRDRNTARLVKSLQGGDAIDDALGDPNDRKLLARRMEAYLAFAANFGPARAAEPQLYWSHLVERPRGLTVRLVGLNTALLSSGDADFGHLQLGREQIARAFGEPPIADERELVMALSHHPFSGWLADAKDALASLRRYAHVHLSGHVHEAESEESRTGGASHGLLRVVAGAAHADKQASSEIPAGHGYNFAAVVADERGELRLRIWPRKWSDENRDFRPDVNKIPRGKSWAEHALPVRCQPLAAEAPPIDATPSAGVVMLRPAPETTVSRPEPQLPKTGKVRVFIAYAPPDEPEKIEFEKALVMLRRQGLIEIGSSRGAGAVDPALAEAHLVLMLITPEYLASDFCYEVEMPAIKARLDAGAAACVVLVKEVELGKREAEFKRIASGERVLAWYETLARLPYARGRDQNNEPSGWDRDGIPVTRWSKRDEAWAEIAREVRDEIERLCAQRAARST